MVFQDYDIRPKVSHMVVSDTRNGPWSSTYTVISQSEASIRPRGQAQRPWLDPPGATAHDSHAVPSWITLSIPHEPMKSNRIGESRHTPGTPEALKAQCPSLTCSAKPTPHDAVHLFFLWSPRRPGFIPQFEDRRHSFLLLSLASSPPATLDKRLGNNKPRCRPLSSAQHVPVLPKMSREVASCFVRPKTPSPYAVMISAHPPA